MASEQQPAPETKSRAEFLKAPEEIRELIKAVLQAERAVMHMRTRPGIHQTILQDVKRFIQ